MLKYYCQKTSVSRAVKIVLRHTERDTQKAPKSRFCGLGGDPTANGTPTTNDFWAFYLLIYNFMRFYACFTAHGSYLTRLKKSKV